MKRAFTFAVVVLLVGAALPVATAAAPQTYDAELAIQQSDYIRQDVGTTRADNSTVYIVHDGTVMIKPQNFDAADVVGFGVATNVGQLTYDRQLGVYHFNAENNTGTFQLYWEVEQTQVVTANNSTTTQTVIRRHTATVRVDANKAYRHVEAGTMSQTRQYAQNWEEWKNSLERIYGPDVNIQQRTQWSVEINKVRANPARVLSGNFTGILLAMVMSLGGLLVLGLFVGLHIASNWSAWTYIRETESLKADEQAADEKLEAIAFDEKKRRLANADWNDLDWPDSVARAYRRVGKTPFRAILELAAARTPANLIEHRLQAMGQCGYVGVVERGDLRSDGGDADSDPDAETDTEAGVDAETDTEANADAAAPIVEADVLPEDAVADDAETETHDLTSPSDKFVKALDNSNERVREFDLIDADVDAAKITVEQASMDLEELMGELDAQRQDFENPEEWGEYLLEFVEFVREHDFTDEHGSPDEIQWIINQWMDADDVLADIFEIPHFKFESEALQFALDRRDPVDEASQLVDDVQHGRFA